MILGTQVMVGTRTPLRVSLFGGGSDFPDYINDRGHGAVLSFGISRYVYLFLKPRLDSQVRMAYSKVEVVNSVEELQHDIAKTCLLKSKITNGIEIHTIADISSAGSGLGSSSAFTVGLLNCIYTHTGKSVYSSYSLARDACEIEIEDLGQPIGIQDQYACALGGVSLLTLLPKYQVRAQKFYISFDFLPGSLCLFNTGKTRRAETILTEQKNNIPNSYEFLDYIRDSALKGSEYLVSKDFKSLGSLMHDNWQAKKQLSSTVSNPDIDSMYQLALSNGALGGKICGAGGGGYLLCVVLPENKAKLVAAMVDAGFPELPFEIDTFGTSRIL